MTGTMNAAQKQTTAAEARPRVRTAVAVIVRSLPRRDQTHMLREIDELERQGQPVVLVPLVRHRNESAGETSAWFQRAVRLPRISFAVLTALLRRLVKQPLRCTAVLARLVAGMALHPFSLARCLLLLPRLALLADELERRGIRHIHAYSARYAATAAWIVHELTGISYSFTVHGPDVFTRRPLLAQKIAKAKIVRSASVFNEAFLRGLYPEIAEEKIEVVRRGLNPDLYAIAAGEQPRDARPARILSVASLVPSKGLGILVEACHALLREGVELECRIIGDGPLLRPLQSLVDSLGLAESVHLLGLQPQEEVARQMTDCDLFVLPGTIGADGQMDGIPMSLMEAMAARKPVVAPAIAGIPELVADGVSGILVDSTHVPRIAAAMRRLIADPELRRSMGEAGHLRVREQFDVRLTAAELIELMERHEPVHPALAERITALDLPELRGTAVAARAVHERRDSFVAELVLTGLAGRREVVIKQHRTRAGESRPARERARHERDVLTMLRGALVAATADPETAFTVPQVVAFDAEKGVVGMTRALGTPLDRLITSVRNAPWTSGRLLLPLRRAGAWLQEMQRVTRAGDADDGRHVLTALVLLALGDLDLAAAREPALRSRREWITGRLHELEARVATLPLSVSGHHGDYWPGNVFVSRQGIEVIDFEGFREGLPLEDVAWFLVHLQLPFAVPLLGSLVSRLSQAFLDGYLGATGRLDRDTLRLVTAAKALHVLARGIGGRGWRRWMKRRALRLTILRSLA